jgi:hypothetical protein
MKKLLTLSCILLLTSCASVNITKTAEGYYEPTNANHISILKTVPKTDYVELGTITVTGFDASQEAKMHNAIRQKSSALGATSVVITSQGIIPGGWNGVMWASGVAIYDKIKVKPKK